MDEALERLVAQQACRELVLHAAACADAGDARALSLLFAEDAELVRPNADHLYGREAIYVAYSQRPENRISRHLITNTQVELHLPERARARSYVLLWTGTLIDSVGPAGSPADARQMVGEFDDRLVCMSDGKWLIQQRHARFVLHRDS